MKQIIGILARPEKNKEGNSMYGIYYKLASAVTVLGGIPLGIIPPLDRDYYKLSYDGNNKDYQDIINVIKKCDGVILQGGDNFYDYDIKAIEYLYENDIPTLGICLGMQAMSFFGGASLYPVKNHQSKDDYVHEVTIDKDSKLYEVIKKENIMVNSRHNMAMTKPTFKINAMSSDNIIEGVEAENKKFFIGVEWHPETMIKYDKNSKKLLKCFIDICKK